MRHRTAPYTGLGNSAKVILPNTGKITPPIKLCFAEALHLYFKKWGGLDYWITREGIKLGIEPAYQYEDLKIILIHKEKEKSYIETGRAWGAYGSEIARRRKYYSDYRYNAKFKKFIDKWHPRIFDGTR